jgi:hypothetical protein
MSELDLSDLEITDEALREIQKAWEARLLRLKNPYVFDLIKALARYPKCRRIIVLDTVHRNRKNAGLPIPRSFDDTVQRALEYYCIDSDVFRARKVPMSEALFCWPEGKGAGVWALIHANARPWVRAHIERLPSKILKS